MPAEEVVLVPCQFSRGGFPTERVFHIETSTGSVMRGIAPTEYCYGADKKPLRGEPRRGEKERGFLTGVILGQVEGEDAVRVHLPDGEIYEIPETDLVRNGALRDVSLQP